jgi:uncharacterized membrane protein YvbJ
LLQWEIYQDWTSSIKKQNKSVKIKDNLYIITACISLVVILWGVFLAYNAQLRRIDNLEEKIARNIQQTLKALIYNENIPLRERTTACDNYIELGFNSYTQEYCNRLLFRYER